MKKSTFLLALIAMLGLNVSCNDRERGIDDIQREETPLEDIGEGFDEAGDDMEEAIDD